MIRPTIRSPHRSALEKAIEYAEAAERLDSAGEYEDRDVRLRFAEVWASIARASRPDPKDPKRLEEI